MNNMRIIIVLSVLFFVLSCKNEKIVFNSEYFNMQETVINTYNEMLKKTEEESGQLNDYDKKLEYQFAQGVYSLVMESYVEKGNPADPQITVWMRPGRKFAGDNPNTIYSQSFVEDKYIYKITGKLGNEVYFGLQLYKTENGANIPSGNINMKDMVLNKDGSFEIILSKEKPSNAKNWLALTSNDYTFLTRQYFTSRNDINPGYIEIKRIDNMPFENNLETRISLANKKLRDYFLATFEANKMAKELSFNKYAPPNAPARQVSFAGALYPTLDNTYDGFWLSLKKGEAMHLHGKSLPKALYASFTFYNMWYMTPDYRYVNCYRTANELVLNKDGSYDIYISPEKVESPNWIDTDKQYEGTFAIRYLLAETKEFPTLEIVKIADIKK